MLVIIYCHDFVTHTQQLCVQYAQLCKQIAFKDTILIVYMQEPLKLFHIRNKNKNANLLWHTLFGNGLTEGFVH